MKITAIRQQVKRAGRYSIFVEGKYAFSLSESALLESKLVSGQVLNKERLEEFKKLSADDKLQQQALRYVAMRSRTEWEVKTYLERKDASPALVITILNKLSNLHLLDDADYARRFIADRRSVRSASRRKIIYELRRKHIAEDSYREWLNEDSGADSEQTTLQALIQRKRKQAKYQDDLKLMQYLARQGFLYADIKSALNKESDE